MKTSMPYVICVALSLTFWTIFGDSTTSESQAQPPASKPASSPSSTTKPDDLDLGNGMKLKLVLIPAGKFMMGSKWPELGRRNDEGPQHEVTITKPFFMGAYTVTEDLYLCIMGSIPYDPALTLNARGPRPTANQPLVQVTWYEAVEFCRRLSVATGNKVRLPTEAEWEYACRAGTTTPFYTGERISLLDANFSGSGYRELTGKGGVAHQGRTAVGSYPPNPWGLYDMHSNVPQWCQDWYSDNYKKSGNVDPRGPDKGSCRVFRGGGPTSSAAEIRSACRWGGGPNEHPGAGFRVVAEAPLLLPQEFTAVFKFQSIGQGKYIESAIHTVKATSMPSGPMTELVVPNKTLAGKGPDPNEDIYKAVKDAKKDNLLKIKCLQATAASPSVIQSVEPYKLSPGEDRPDVYVFKAKTTQKVGNEERQAIVIHKYLHEMILLVPVKRDDKYKLVPDGDMIKTIDALTPGDSVEIKFSGQTLTFIKRWTAPA